MMSLSMVSTTLIVPAKVSTIESAATVVPMALIGMRNHLGSPVLYGFDPFPAL
jgi:hypothetical protein